MAALGRKKIERRRVPTLRFEDRPEQKGPKTDLDAGLAGQRVNAHGGRIRIGRGEFEPEVQGRHPHRTILVPAYAQRHVRRNIPMPAGLSPPEWRGAKERPKECPKEL